jgi:hypothetical protein
VIKIGQEKEGTVAYFKRLFQKLERLREAMLIDPRVTVWL